ncbi:MAG: nuclear transport factor 2 family protein [Aequorivita sp.]
MTNDKKTEEVVVQKQLDAYNQRDLDKFLATYSNEIEIYNFGENTSFIDGIEHLRKVYTEVYNDSPNLNASIKNRIVFDNKIIDQEEVTGRSGIKLLKVIAIYEVELDLISKVTFIREK